MDVDPIVKQATADGVIERASIELEKILVELATALDPFPGFMGLQTLQAVELENVGVSADVGCVVVCPDGGLYELVIQMTPGPVDLGGVDHTEQLKELGNL